MNPKTFLEQIKSYETIGTVGLCKNAGKTTVLKYLIEELHEDYKLGITSIGYDGEKEDVITKLPKPRIKVYAGMYVATTISSLYQTEIAYDVCLKTDINTSLGQVVIVQAMSEGIIEIAGPVTARQINSITEMILSLGANKVIVDGAAGRLSYSVYMDCTVLSVGAAMHTDMKHVVRDAAHKIRLLTLKQAELPDKLDLTNHIHYEEAFINEGYWFFFKGALVDEDLHQIIKHYKDHKKTLVINDGTAAFISPKGYHRFIRKDGDICVKKAVNLVAVTINPMSPYGEWFDEEAFLEAVTEVTEIPVYNILNEKGER